MEAKDTVIDIGEDKYDGLGAVDLVEIQAEISFKAGKEEANFEWRNKKVPKIMKQFKEAGIEEVVEWVEEHTHNIEEWTGWQEQKEEWGIKEGA